MNEETYQLDEETAAYLFELLEQIKGLNAQAQGALTLYVRQHKLKGQWRIADNGRELRRLRADMGSNWESQTEPAEANGR